MKKVLFVCMGNICRSPAGEGIMQKFVEEAGLSEQIYSDSAGTIGYHSGARADSRMIVHAKKRGFNLLSISRQFDSNSDFLEFDYIIAMDNRNMLDLRSLTENEKHLKKLSLMTDYCKKVKASEVPDPYYDGEAGFEHVLDIVEDGCRNLLEEIKKDL